MNERDDFDRFVHEWLTDGATRRAPTNLIDELSIAVRSRRPRPRWISALRGDDMESPVRLGSWNPRPILLLGLLVALVVAIAGGALVVGGLSRLPRPALPSPAANASSSPSFAELPPLRPVSAGGSLQIGESDGVARRFATDGVSLWVGTNADILEIDPTSAAIAARVTPPPTGDAFQFAVTPGSVWVVGKDPASITRYDARTGRSSAVIDVPTPATWIASTAGAIWLGSLNAGTITRIDPATDRVVATIRVADPGIGTRAVDGSDGAVWIGLPPTGTVVRIDPTTNAIAATVTVPALVGSSPDSVRYAATGGNLWALANSDQGWATVSAVDLDTSASTWTTRLRGLVSSPIVRRDAIWVELLGVPSSAPTPAIVAIDPISGRVIDALGDTGGPASDLFDAFGSVWATRFAPANRLDRFPSDVLAVQAR